VTLPIVAPRVKLVRAFPTNWEFIFSKTRKGPDRAATNRGGGSGDGPVLTRAARWPSG